MNVLVAGSGGREHALAWRLAQSASVATVLVAPGNPGIARDGRIRCIADPVTPELLRKYAVDLVVIGPEVPLVEGLADELRDAGADVVGPSAALARLEGSKAYAKEFMAQNGIRTAGHRTCRSVEEARAAVAEFGVPVVVKADGLAAGKGVSVCASEREAHAAIETIMRERLFGDAGETVVVEEFLRGFEASVIVMVDETSWLTLPTARDHKQIGEGSVGANTGGMGAVAPNPLITPELSAVIEREVVEPSVRALQRTGKLFRGFLFIGLMIDGGDPRVLEYNVRFGDPEAQAILPLIAGDFGVLLRGLARGRLGEAIGESGFSLRDGASCTVVAAAGGYPGPVSRGDLITIGEVPSASRLSGTGEIFFAGVAAVPGAAGDADAGGRAGAGMRAGADGRGVDRGRAEGAGRESLQTAGGRVLAASAVGADLEEARRHAYGLLQLVSFDGMQYRRDIGGDPLVASLIEEGDVPMPQFRKRGGLLPVIVQEASSGDVLMLGYADASAMAASRRSGYATFWSTSRNTLWTKGETSGDRLRIEEIRVDCDQDALLYRVTLEGNGVCHTRGTAGETRRRCFYRRLTPEGTLENEAP
jgi:phosphoribosylamine---glycine ligase